MPKLDHRNGFSPLDQISKCQFFDGGMKRLQPSQKLQKEEIGNNIPNQTSSNCWKKPYSVIYMHNYSDTANPRA